MTKLSYVSQHNTAGYFGVQTPYAQSVNAKFKSSEDTLISVRDRFIAAVSADDEEFLKSILGEFRSRFPQYTCFKDMYKDMVKMGSSSEDRITIKQLLINTVIQRELDVEWVFNICGKFDPFFVNIIRVYPVENKKVTGKLKNTGAYYAVWDGQHTVTSLIAVAMFGFGLSWEETLELEVPVAVYPNTNIAKLRQRFIGVHDGAMTKALDKIDLYMQYVWAVRHNNDTDPWSKRFEEIQSAMEEFNCFFTHEKFGDTDMPGAISRPSEIYPNGRDVNKWKSSVLRRVFQYHNIAIPDLPVEPLEIDNMSHIFRACDQQGIEVNDEYVRQFAKYLGVVTGNTWAKGYKSSINKKHKMVMNAYKSWLKRQHYRIRENYNERCNQTEVAPTWICQAIKAAGFPFEVPVFIGKFAYDFNNNELGV